MNKKKIIKLSPLIVLVLAAVCLLVTVLMTNIILIKWHIVGMGFLAIATITQIIHEKYGYWMTLLPLISGTFSFAALTPMIFLFGIGVIQFDPSFC